MRRPVRVVWRSGTLGVKIDECPRCGTVGRHRLERQLRWVTVGPVGVLPLGARHGLECATCWAWTPMRRADLRRGTRTGRLALPERPRPASAAAVTAGEPAPDLDRVISTGALDGATAYLGAWLIVVAILLGLAVQQRGVETATADVPRCLVVVGLRPGQPVPTPPVIVTPTLCVFPHNFEPLATPALAYGPSATVPPYATVVTDVAAACGTAFKDAFGTPAAGTGPTPVVIGPDPRDWARGERFAWCAAADPANPWRASSLPRSR